MESFALLLSCHQIAVMSNCTLTGQRHYNETYPGPELGSMRKDRGAWSEIGREDRSWVYWLPEHHLSSFNGFKALVFTWEFITGKWFESWVCLRGRRLIKSIIYTGQVQELVLTFLTWQRAHLPISHQMPLRDFLREKRSQLRSGEWTFSLILFFALVTCHLIFSDDLFLLLVKSSSKWSWEDLSVQNV